MNHPHRTRILALLTLVMLLVGLVFSASAAAPPDFFMYYPQDGETFPAMNYNVVNFIWQDVPEAETYDFFIREPGETDPENYIVNSEAVAGFFCPDGRCYNGFEPSDPILAEFVDDTTYEWGVTANNVDGSTVSSDGPRQFVYDADWLGPQSPNLLDPKNGTGYVNNDGFDTIRWFPPNDDPETAEDNVATYNLIIDLVGGGSNPVVELIGLTPEFNKAAPESQDPDDALTCGEMMPCELDPTDIKADYAADGLYRWRVAAVDADGDMRFTEDYFFLIDADGVIPGDYALLTPANDGTYTFGRRDPLTFTWEEATNATRYDFFIHDTNTNVQGGGGEVHWDQVGLTPMADNDGLTCEADTCTFTWSMALGDIPGFIPSSWQDGEVYAWGVNATADITSGPNNGPFQFTADIEPTSFALKEPGTAAEPYPTLLKPGDAVDLEIKWVGSYDAVTYDFELTKPDASKVTLADLTPAEDDDALVCADLYDFMQPAGDCVYTLANAGTVIDMAGTYAWTVTATAENENSKAATAPFGFAIVESVVSDFNLLGPADGSIFREALTADTALSFEDLDIATAYKWTLFQISGNVRIAVIADAVEVPTDVCTDGLCSFKPSELTPPVDLTTLESGLYAWTMMAVTDFGEFEALNAPFFFTLGLESFELIAPDDQGFEGLKEAGLTPKDLNGTNSGWDASASLSKMAIKCNKYEDDGTTLKRNFSYAGECALLIKNNGTGNLRYNLPADRFADGDEITISFYVENSKVTEDNSKNIAKMVFKFKGADGKNLKGAENKIVLAIKAPAFVPGSGDTPKFGAAENYSLFEETVPFDVPSEAVGSASKSFFQFQPPTNGAKVLVDQVSITTGPAETPATLMPLPGRQ